ncbi:tumor necrosis factor ligand superfamily member 10-like [Paramormyrops kingsleyae]|uniref:Tumor necrosis factor ligand superfamily member 10 n=1 Tax=Paramormyrops kingsleyae TaxID=1676925 RepID=A0A3B3R8I5_9TELE|nr:tumor necrosis factor ligand superfamily member 10-like [Paramormyrops kingsleyae]
MASQTDQDYFRSVNSESKAYMMVSANGRRDATSKLWVPMVVTVIVVLQIASTTGLFMYLNMSISEVKVQGVKEELRCLSLLSALDQDQEIPQHLVHLFGEPCIKLAEGIKSYISKVTENLILKHTFQEPRVRPRVKSPTGPQRPSAHLTLRDSSGPASTLKAPQPDLHQSCRHPLRSWTSHSFGAHLHNMTLSNGQLRVPQDGRYFLYAQVYFRYPSPSEGDLGSTSHQLIQCVYKKTSYIQPIQLLKGVGTKCWAPDAEYGLHSVYQAGLFELRAGDELFVSVSSPGTVHADESSSYFGAFRLDL